MGRKSKAKQASRPVEVPLRTAPNWPLLALSLVGIALTGYLTITAFAGGAVRGCTEGSGCDVVLSSRWATMFGLPTAFWGLVAYLGLAAMAVFLRRMDQHWKYTWTAALLGVAYSVYLTGVSFAVLKASCPYCLTSLALMIAILALTTWQRPEGLARFSWNSWLLRRIPLAAFFVFALHLQYAAEPPAPEDPVTRALAEHLGASGATFYGAQWCEHCNQQKRLFGSSAGRLPYVECSPGGQRAPQASVCREAGITTYPTWVFPNQRVEGVMSITDLAKTTGYRLPGK